MKKLIAMLLALALCLSFAACGSSEKAPAAEVTEETAAEETTETEEAEAAAEEEPALPTNVWVNLYSGSKLTLNDDGTMTFGEYPGTWELNGTVLTVQYSSASEIKRDFELLEEKRRPTAAWQLHCDGQRQPERYGRHGSLSGRQD